MITTATSDNRGNNSVLKRFNFENEIKISVNTNNIWNFPPITTAPIEKDLGTPLPTVAVFPSLILIFFCGPTSIFSFTNPTLS